MGFPTSCWITLYLIFQLLEYWHLSELEGKGMNRTRWGNKSFQTEEEGTPQDFMKSAANSSSHTTQEPVHGVMQNHRGLVSGCLLFVNLIPQGILRTATAPVLTLTSGRGEGQLSGF